MRITASNMASTNNVRSHWGEYHRERSKELNARHKRQRLPDSGTIIGASWCGYQVEAGTSALSVVVNVDLSL